MAVRSVCSSAWCCVAVYSRAWQCAVVVVVRVAVRSRAWCVAVCVAVRAVGSGVWQCVVAWSAVERPPHPHHIRAITSRARACVERAAVCSGA